MLNAEECTISVVARAGGMVPWVRIMCWLSVYNVWCIFHFDLPSPLLLYHAFPIDSLNGEFTRGFFLTKI